MDENSVIDEKSLNEEMEKIALFVPSLQNLKNLSTVKHIVDETVASTAGETISKIAPVFSYTYTSNDFIQDDHTISDIISKPSAFAQKKDQHAIASLAVAESELYSESDLFADMEGLLAQGINDEVRASVKYSAHRGAFSSYIPKKIDFENPDYSFFVKDISTLLTSDFITKNDKDLKEVKKNYSKNVFYKVNDLPKHLRTLKARKEYQLFKKTEAEALLPSSQNIENNVGKELAIEKMDTFMKNRVPKNLLFKGSLKWNDFIFQQHKKYFEILNEQTNKYTRFHKKFLKVEKYLFNNQEISLKKYKEAIAYLTENGVISGKFFGYSDFDFFKVKKILNLKTSEFNNSFRKVALLYYANFIINFEQNKIYLKKLKKLKKKNSVINRNDLYAFKSRRHGHSKLSELVHLRQVKNFHIFIKNQFKRFLLFENKTSVGNSKIINDNNLV